MGHCVDTYIAACERGKSIIFSVRDGLGVHRSTFELSIRNLDLSQFEIDVVQHAGRGNSSPCSAAVDCLNAFLHALRSPVGTAWLKRFNRERTLRKVSPQFVRDHQMAVALRAFLENQPEDRLDFDVLLDSFRVQNSAGDSPHRSPTGGPPARIN